MKALFRIGLFSLTTLLMIGPVRALDFEWTGASGSWSDAANWNHPFPPGGSDRILLSPLSSGGAIVVDVGGSQLINRFLHNGAQGSYTFGTTPGGDTISTFLGLGDLLLNQTSGQSLTINANLLLGGNGLQRFNSHNPGTNSGQIIVNGDVRPADSATGLMPLVLTTSNNATGPWVVVNGVIADGPAATIALVAGREATAAGTVIANYSGQVAVTGLNTFTGPTRVTGGILTFNSIANVGGPANALGQPALADSAILLGSTAGNGISGRLRYVGTGHTSNRVITLAGLDNASQVIESSGTGPLVLTGGVANPANGQTLVLTGSNTGNNTLGGTIEPGVGSDITSLVKQGAGKWIISGNSPALDGNLTVQAGELVLSGSIGTATTAAGVLSVSSGATVVLDGGFHNTRDLNVTAGGTFDFRSGELRISAGTAAGGSGSFAIGTNGVGTMRLTGGTGSFGNITIDGPDDTLAISAGGAYAFSQINNLNGGTLLFTGGTVNLATAGQGLTTGAGSITGSITGPGGITKIGPGTLQVGFSATNYSGKTNINQGVLEVTAAGRLSDASTVNVAAGGTLRLLTSVADAIFGLEGAGHVDLGDATLVIGNSMAPGTTGGVGIFTGTMSDGPGPAEGDLEKRGSGTFTMAGTATYSGFTQVLDGTMIVTGSITGTSAVRLPDGPVGSSQTLRLAGGTIVTSGNVTADQAGAVLDIVSGSLTASRIDVVAGTAYNTTFNWNAGHIRLTNPTGVNVGVAPGIDQPFQNSLTLGAGRTLEIDATTTVGANGTLTLAGGTLVTGNLANTSGGNFAFNTGTLRMTQDQTVSAAFAAAADLDSLIGANRTFEVDGTATIETPLVLVGGTLRLGTVVNPQHLILHSGLFEVTGSDLAIAASTMLNVSGGMTVNVTAGGLDNAGQLNTIGGTVQFAGPSTNQTGGEINAINAALSFPGGLTNNGKLNLINTTVDGNVTSGAGGSAALVGSNSFGDNLTLNGASTLFIDIAGAAPGEFDVVTVGGTATLDGVLSVTLTGGFVPSLGAQFEVLSASQIIDQGLTLGGPAAGLFTMTIGATGVILQAGPGLTGDYNGDGRVDAGDYTVWRNHVGQTGGLANDPIGGVIGAAHYLQWKDHYGQSILSSAVNSAPQQVPEPQAWAMLALAVAIQVARARGRVPDKRRVPGVRLRQWLST